MDTSICCVTGLPPHIWEDIVRKRLTDFYQADTLIEKSLEAANARVLAFGASVGAISDSECKTATTSP